MEDSQRKLSVEIAIQPKTYDIDIADHVNNIVYVQWMEDLRFAWLEAYYPLKPLMEKDIAPVILETKIRYHRAIELFDEVKGMIWVSGMKGVRSTLEFEFTANGQVAATGTQLAAWIDIPSGKPVRLPEGLKALWGRE